MLFRKSNREALDEHADRTLAVSLYIYALAFLHWLQTSETTEDSQYLLNIFSRLLPFVYYAL